MHQCTNLFPDSERLRECRITGKVPCGATAPDQELNLYNNNKENQREYCLSGEVPFGPTAPDQQLSTNKL